MAFCTRCGNELAPGASYCGSCGFSGLHSSGTAPFDGLGVSMNIAALLAYVLFFVSGVFFLLVDPYKHDRGVRFHAFQSIFYSLVYFVLSMVHSTLSVFFMAMPVPGISHLLNMIWAFVSLAFLAGWVVLIVKAYQYEEFKLPYIGPLASHYAG